MLADLRDNNCACAPPDSDCELGDLEGAWVGMAARVDRPRWPLQRGGDGRLRGGGERPGGQSAVGRRRRGSVRLLKGQ